MSLAKLFPDYEESFGLTLITGSQLMIGVWLEITMKKVSMKAMPTFAKLAS